jgi:hypothetical protein
MYYKKLRQKFCQLGVNSLQCVVMKISLVTNTSNTAYCKTYKYNKVFPWH